MKRRTVKTKKAKGISKNWLLVVLIVLSGLLILTTFIFLKQSKEYDSFSQAESAGSGWLSGASDIAGEIDGKAEPEKSWQKFEEWRGSPVTIAGVWSDATAGDQENMWAYNNYQNFPHNLDLSVGAIYDGETFADAASGKLDARYKASLANIDKTWNSKKTIFLRYAHEFNGSWYKWSVKSSNAEDYKKAFQRFHGLVQSELVAKGRDAKVVWSPNDGSHSDASAEQMYPGNQYVDVIGVDSYDWDPQRTASNWESAANAKESDGSPRGIEAWRQFALAKGKPLSFPEWGCNPSKVVDCPFYIQKMNEFFRTNAGTGPGQVWYEIYFNSWDNDKIFPTTNVPQAAAMYKSLKWGDGGVSGITPAVTSATTPLITAEPTLITPTLYCGGSQYCVPSETITPPDTQVTPVTETTPEVTQPEENTDPNTTITPNGGGDNDGDNGGDGGGRNRGGFFQMIFQFLSSFIELLLRLLGFSS